jgi:hypothetical protein
MKKNTYYLVVIAMLMPLLIGCNFQEDSIYSSKDTEPFAPREYYRTHIDKGIVGVALMNYSFVEEELVADILKHHHVTDAIVLKNKNEYFVAVKPKRFARMHSGKIKEDLQVIMAGKNITGEVYTEPSKYRLAKKLSIKRRVQPEVHEQLMELFLQKK